ncbi:hypothetical protein [Motilimonas sp. KMU-193]|uniref:hypothetical protein n=1 Tax=Motilimonas sp. KMU-193 TaxID=3388668 RepID=UPI00396B1387
MNEPSSLLCVLASGECLPGIMPEDVRLKLRNEWQLSEHECDAWLSQQQVFCRQGLSEIEADTWQATFADLGLKSTLVTQQELDNPPQQANQDGLKAQRYLSLATSLLLFTYIIDDTLLGSHLLDMENLDFGYLPYLLAVFVMTKGLYHFVKLKGYSGYLSLLGLSGLFGLGTCLLLPNRSDFAADAIPRRLWQSSTLFAVFCLLFGAVTGYQLLGNYLYQEQYIEISRQLQLGRHQYPSPEQDKLVATYQAEWQELNEFIDQGFYYIAEQELRPNYQAAMLTAIGEEIDHFFTWINYQKYLQQQGVSLPTSAHFVLAAKQIDQWQQQVFGKMLAFRSGYQPGDQVFTSLTKYLGQGTVRYQDVESANAVGAYIGSLYKALQQARLQYIVKHQKVGQEEPIWPLDLTPLRTSDALPNYVTAQHGKDTVTFTFNAGPLAGYPPLVIAVIRKHKPSTQWQRGGMGYHFKQISPGFPNHLLYSFGLRTLDEPIKRQFFK